MRCPKLGSTSSSQFFILSTSKRDSVISRQLSHLRHVTQVALILGLLSLVSPPASLEASPVSSSSASSSSAQDRSADPFASHRGRLNHWAMELSRWTRFCVQRKERAHPLFHGCRDQLWATQGRWAMLRMRRITGFGGFDKTPLVPEVWTTPSTLSSLERAWRIAFMLEALYASGDARWVAPLNREGRQLYQYWSARECVLGTDCPMALYWLLKASEVTWAQLPQSDLKSTRSSVSARALSASIREEAIKTWSEIGAWARPLAQRLHAGHPNGSLAIDHTRGGRTSWWAERAMLAELTLDDEQLSDWWMQENEQAQGALIPIASPLQPARFGIHFNRAFGLGLIAMRLKDSALLEALLMHLTEGMKVYQKHRREYKSYSHRVPQSGILSLSTTFKGRLGLSFSPSTWRYPAEVTPPLKSIPPTGVHQPGMFSKIAVRADGTRRGLYFVRPNGAEVLESEVDFSRPDLLQVAYTQDMLSAYAFVPSIKRALIVGLGGGGMVHALNRYHPQLQLDVVEIDPVVVDIARQYFGVTDHPKVASPQNQKNSSPQEGYTRVITEDGFVFLRQPHTPYDVIYLDAFLQPTEETDSTGSPLKLKTLAFLKEIQSQLTDQGVVVVNMNEHPELRRDISTFRAAFAHSLVWKVPQTGNWIALGFKSTPVESSTALSQHAREIERSLELPFNLNMLLERALAGTPQ